MSIKDLQTVVHLIDRKMVVLQKRTGRNTIIGFLEI
jgi:hypothetical protein